MALRIVTAPTNPVVPLEGDTGLKHHCRVDGPADDTYLQALEVAVVRHLQEVTGRQLLEGVFEAHLERFPRRDPVIELPRSPVRSVDSIQYVDAAGATQTLDPSLYQTDLVTLPGRIAPTYGTTWPAVRPGFGSVVITFKAGHDQDIAAHALVPGDALHLVKLLVQHLYENREPVTVGFTADKLPLGFDMLLEPVMVR